MIGKIEEYIRTIAFDEITLEELEHLTNIFIALENRNLNRLEREARNRGVVCGVHFKKTDKDE